MQLTVLRPAGALLLALFCMNTSSYSQTLSNVHAIGGLDSDAAFGIAVDKDGNQYVTGFFIATVDFDPGPGVYNLTATGLYDAFVCKYDNHNRLVWAKAFNGALEKYGKGIAVDGSGNVYVIGNYRGTVDFDPGPAVANQISKGGYDIFIVKLDQSGNYQWAVSYGATRDNDHGNAITVDVSGNVFVTGSFSEYVDFDPGPGDFTLWGQGDVFVVKLSTTGSLVWMSKLGGDWHDEAYAICLDQSGNVYTCGSFTGNPDMDPGPNEFLLPYTYSDNDAFISKLDPSGNFVWAKSITALQSYYCYPYGIVADKSGNVFVAGSWRGTADFNPGAGVYNMAAQGLTDGFVLKLNPNGDFTWAKPVGGCQIDDYCNAIALDDAGNVYATGVFQYIADFDPGTGVHEMHASGGTDGFIVKMTNGGSFLDSKQMGGGFSDYSMSISIRGQTFTQLDILKSLVISNLDQRHTC